MVAAFAMSATTLVVASPALAKCNAECKQHKQEAKKHKQEAKEKKKREKAEKKKAALEAKLKHSEEQLKNDEAQIKQLAKEEAEAQAKGEEQVRAELAAEIAKLEAERATLQSEQETFRKDKTEQEAAERLANSEWAPFKDCPINSAEEVKGCIYAKSYGDSEFQAGNVTVHLINPITLRGGKARDGAFVGPEDGAATVEPVAQPAPDLRKDVEVSALSEAEQARYKNALNEGHESVTATVELAGEPSTIVLNETHLLEETSETALALPVKVKLSNPFLGETCYVGSDEHPIVINLVSGTSGVLSGVAGELSSNEAGSILTLAQDSLVNNTYVAPGVNGCGVAGGADTAIDHAIGLPSLTPGSNLAIIDGTLESAGAEEATEAFEAEGRPIT